MADTDDDVTRLGEMMTDTGWQPMTPDTPRVIARYLLNQGVTLPPPPPDPADDQTCRSKDRAVLEAAQPQWTALNYACSGGRAKHLSDLTPDEASVFRTRCIDLAEGRAVWAESSDPQWLGWTLNYGDEVAA